MTLPCVHVFYHRGCTRISPGDLSSVNDDQCQGYISYQLTIGRREESGGGGGGGAGRGGGQCVTE